MTFENELNALRLVSEALTPLEADARRRVIDYVCHMLQLEPPKSQKLKPDGGAGRTFQNADSATKPTSPQEYLRRFPYRTMTKKIGVIAVFLERERGKSRFALRDITEAFRQAKEAKIPAHSQYGRAQTMNYLAKEGELYYATNQAEALVDAYAAESEETATEDS